MGAKLTEVGAVEFDKRPPCVAQYVPSISGSHACVVTVGNCATATLTIGTHKTTATSNTKRCAIRRSPQCPPAVLAHHRSTNNARNDHCMRLPRTLAAATRQHSNYGGGTHVETQVYVISTPMASVLSNSKITKTSVCRCFCAALGQARPLARARTLRFAMVIVDQNVGCRTY